MRESIPKIIKILERVYLNYFKYYLNWIKGMGCGYLCPSLLTTMTGCNSTVENAVLHKTDPKYHIV